MRAADHPTDLHGRPRLEGPAHHRCSVVTREGCGARAISRKAEKLCRRRKSGCLDNEENGKR